MLMNGYKVKDEPRLKLDVFVAITGSFHEPINSRRKTHQ